MPEPAPHYIPLDLAATMRKQARRVWLTAFAAVFIWLLLIVSAPVLKITGTEAISSPLYYSFSFLCHQIPERSLGQFAVCSRCFGVYGGLLLGFAIYPLWRDFDEIRPLPRVWLILSLVPISIDWSLSFLGIWENTQLSRLLTGMIVGSACSTFVVPALVEITRNYSYRRKVR